MNPLTNIKNIQKLNERELELGIIGKKSWHDEYKDSAWIYIGGLPYDLTEGDVICVFSQYGEVVNLNLVRDNKTGNFKGFGFLCYEDQRSTVLAVDNLNGIKILSRTIRVDHVKDYKLPKEHGDEDDATLKIRNEGCAPQLDSSSEAGMKDSSDEEHVKKAVKKEKKSKKQKKKKKKKKQKRAVSSSSVSDSDDDVRGSPHEVEVKQERNDEGYNKALKKEDLYRSDSSDSRHGSRDKGYRNGRDKHKYGGSNDSRDRNDSSRDRNDRSRDRNDGSRDRNDSSRDRNDSSRDWNERTDRKDSGRDRSDIRRNREDSSRDRDSNYSRDRYTNNGFHGQDDFRNRFDSSNTNRGRGRAYEDHGGKGRYGEGGGDRSWDRGRGRGRGRGWGGRGVRGNYRGQNTFFDERRERSRESYY